MRIYRILSMLVFVVMLSACAASRKTSVSVSGEVADSIRQELTDTAIKKVENTVASTIVVGDSSRVVTSATESGSNNELINERITETVDKDGNRTTTTDRTIQRSGKYDRQQSSEEMRRWQEIQTKLMLSKLDSIANSRYSKYDNHWAKNDSTTTDREKNTKNITASNSPWQQMKSFVFVMIIIFIIISIARLIQNKK